jgi:methyl-accepting chemotaxis protein
MIRGLNSAFSQTKPSSLSLTKVISVSFTVFVLALVIISYQSLIGLTSVTQNLVQFSERALPLSIANNQLAQSVLKHSNLVKDYVRIQDLKRLDNISMALSQVENEIVISVEKLRQFIAPDSALTANTHTLISTMTVDLAQNSHSVVQIQQTRLKQKLTMQTDIDTFRYGLTSIGSELSRIANMFAFDNPEALDAANRFVSNASRMESLFLMLLMENSPDKARGFYNQLNTHLAAIDLAYDDFKEWYNVFDDFPSFTTSYNIVQQGFSNDGILAQTLSLLDRLTTLNDTLNTVIENANQTIESLDSISIQAESNIQVTQQHLNQKVTQIRTTQLGLSGGAMLITLWAGFHLRRWIRKALDAVTLGLECISKKDFTKQLDIESPSELKQIASSVNQLIEIMRISLGQVKDTAVTVNDFSQQNSSAAKHNQITLEEQNSTLATMNETVSQIEASISDISKLSVNCHEQSQTSVAHTNKGLQVIEHSVSKLNSLDNVLSTNEASMYQLMTCVTRIQSMVDVISSIAESTNLLALNAAIEAARAGEQGRGFSVVADEVRRLASDTSKQTSQISSQMSELVNAAENAQQAVVLSRQEMSNSLKASDEVICSFDAIAQSVKLIAQQIEQISTATVEQEKATSSVNQSIFEIKQKGISAAQNLESMVKVSHRLTLEANQQQQRLEDYIL